MWYRVFARSTIPVPPSRLVEHLHLQGCTVVPHFKGDDLGWTSGQLLLPCPAGPILLDRYLTDEDEIRDELNAYAAELETITYADPAAMMERVVTTQQLITIRRPIECANDVLLDKVLLATCQLLAQHCDGVYQIDGQGWFDGNGTLLIAEY
jgi:hypothetical protein